MEHNEHLHFLAHQLLVCQVSQPFNSQQYMKFFCGKYMASVYFLFEHFALLFWLSGTLFTLAQAGECPDVPGPFSQLLSSVFIQLAIMHNLCERLCVRNCVWPCNKKGLIFFIRLAISVPLWIIAPCFGQKFSKQKLLLHV